MDGYITYESARSTQADALGDAIVRLRERVQAAAADGGLRGPGPVFLGVGASLAATNAAVWDLRARGIDAWRLGAGDTPLPLPHSEHPIVGISQSGRSTETLAALASVAPELRLGVVNNSTSPLADLVDRRFDLGDIPDSYASTIGYTATVVALSMIAEAWDGGTIDPSWAGFSEVFRAFDERLSTGVEAAAALFQTAPSSDFVGGGASAGSAEAGALLFREVARIPSSAMSTRQYLHGAMESAGEGVHVLFGGAREVEVARMLTAAGHPVVLVIAEAEAADLLAEAGLDASSGAGGVRDAAGTAGPLAVITLPAGSIHQRSILEALVLQVLVERVAALRGVDIEEFVFENTDTKVPTPQPTA
ncbi:SIS domain-containing protein [Plantibacter sp. Mn2098]|uniref:SIS domain-containing protein n=1 Tax=Plantibacter sp. Mn2098 TaxID=3395266 RepID=UPI003BEA6D85